jgi:trehalose-6-phosphate synthase
LVNPYDINGMKTSMLAALHANQRDLSRRMRTMRRYLREHDVRIGRRASSTTCGAALALGFG